MTAIRPNPLSGSADNSDDDSRDDPASRAVVTLLAHHGKRLGQGYPWVYSNELQMDAATKRLDPGTLVTLRQALPSGRFRDAAVATFNPHALVAARVFSHDPSERIDAAFLTKRLVAALELRGKFFADPWYRLIHGEADGVPGLVLDRYGDIAVCQINTAGMERLVPALLEAIADAFAPRAVVLRRDGSGRALEGLSEVPAQAAMGEIPDRVQVRENAIVYETDIRAGQKTGWFFDQRENRAHVAALADSGRVLDVFCYAGAFAVLAAKRGAREVLAIDRSEAALDSLARNAALNGVADKCTVRRANAFDALAALAEAGERFDIVFADPPAFVKSRKDLKPGARGYRKLTRLAAALVRPGGFLFVASCSHNVDPPLFAEQVRAGLADGGRVGRILRAGGAAPDHPVHPGLSETAYLKSLLLQLD